MVTNIFTHRIFAPKKDPWACHGLQVNLSTDLQTFHSHIYETGKQMNTKEDFTIIQFNQNIPMSAVFLIVHPYRSFLLQSPPSTSMVLTYTYYTLFLLSTISHHHHHHLHGRIGSDFIEQSMLKLTQ